MFREGSWRATPLWYALSRGRNLKLAAHLLRHGSDPNHCLWTAAFHDDLAAIRLLLANGADPNLRDSRGMTVLHYMLKKGSETRHFELLARHGARGDIPDASGTTAAKLLARKRDPEVRRLAGRSVEGGKRRARGDERRSHESPFWRVLTSMPSRPPARPTSPSPLPPFEHVLEQHGRAVLRFCVAEAGPERADDCFQETMLAALRAYGELRDPGALRGWLFAIAARKVIDLHRSSARAPEPAPDIEALAGVTDPPQRDATLWARVAHLPDKQRRAVTLRYCGDLSHGEIAVVMATSEAAARRNVFEGLARLKQEIAGAGAPRRSHEPALPAVQQTWQPSTRTRTKTQRSKRS